VRYAPTLDLLEMLPQPAEDFLSLRMAELLPEFFQREVDDIVVMNLLRGDIATEFKPNAVQEINLARSEVRRMGPQIKNVFLAAGEIDLKGQLGFGIR
jgi:hypothetical protein